MRDPELLKSLLREMSEDESGMGRAMALLDARVISAR